MNHDEGERFAAYFLFLFWIRLENGPRAGSGLFYCFDS